MPGRPAKRRRAGFTVTELPHKATQATQAAEPTALDGQVADMVSLLSSAGRPDLLRCLQVLVNAHMAASTLSTTTATAAAVRRPRCQEMARLQSLRRIKATSLWDLYPGELQDKILDQAGPLTRFLCRRLGPVDGLSDTTKRSLFVDAFKQDWRGDLALLPDAALSADDIAHVTSRDMYGRLWQRFADPPTRQTVSSVPMRNEWFDCVPLGHPSDLASTALKGGHVAFLKHMLDTNLVEVEHIDQVNWNNGDVCALDYAASKGNLAMVQLILSAGSSAVCTSDTVEWAASSGRLDLVQWLHAHTDADTVEWTPAVMDWAAQEGHLAVVQWLHANRAEGCTVAAMNDAAMNGHLHVVQWLHAHRTEGCTTDAVDEAAKNGHAAVVEWLLANRTERFTYHAVADAATDEMARVLVKSLTPQARQMLLDEAIDYGNKTAIDRLLAAG